MIHTEAACGSVLRVGTMACLTSWLRGSRFDFPRACGYGLQGECRGNVGPLVHFLRDPIPFEIWSAYGQGEP